MSVYVSNCLCIYREVISRNASILMFVANDIQIEYVWKTIRSTVWKCFHSGDNNNSLIECTIRHFSLFSELVFFFRLHFALYVYVGIISSTKIYLKDKFSLPLCASLRSQVYYSFGINLSTWCSSLVAQPILKKFLCIFHVGQIWNCVGLLRIMDFTFYGNGKRHKLFQD